MRRNFGVYDGHLHAHATTGVESYLRNAKDNLSASGLDGMNLLTVRPSRSASVADAYALLAKQLFPGKFTVFTMPSWRLGGFDETPEGVANQVRSFIEAGFDGMKMGMGDAGREHALDEAMFDPMFDVFEEEQFPLLIHVGVSSWIPPKKKFQIIKDKVQGNHERDYIPGVDDDEPAVDNGNKEFVDRVRGEIIRMLDRHPRTPLILPHMFFYYDDLDKAAELLDTHPTLRFDLTPCSPIYYFMSQDPKRSREFITTYRKRLIFGTDNLMEMDPMPVIEYIRGFLETDETFFAAHPQWGFDIQGVYPLPEEVLADIYKNNFFDVVTRHELVPSKVVAYLENLYDITRKYEELPEQNKKDVLEIIGRFKHLL